MSGPGTTDSRNRRPAQTVFGAGMALFTAALYLTAAVAWIISPGSFVSLAIDAGLLDHRDEIQAPLLFTARLLGAGAVGDTVLALAVLAGRNWARLVLMSLSVLTTTVTFLATMQGRESITITHLPTAGASILVLLALSSHRAREFATRTSSA